MRGEAASRVVAAGVTGSPFRAEVPRNLKNRLWTRSGRHAVAVGQAEVLEQRAPAHRLGEDHVGPGLESAALVRLPVPRHHDDPWSSLGAFEDGANDDIARDVR